jgi:YfiH family protein
VSAAEGLAFERSAHGLAFELPGEGRALFTTRAAGNLSTGSGDGHEHGLRLRGDLCERHGLSWVCSSEQVHGTGVHAIEHLAGTGGVPVPIDADGHATTLHGVGAMILCADCLPVAVGCEGAVAMLHAGWRGLAAGVLEEGVRVLRELGRGGAMAAIVGPGAGACCYEVGPEVHAAFAGAGDRGRTLSGGPRPTATRPPAARPSGRGGPIDLRAIAHERLHAAGVSDVRDVDACTICDGRFFSYRREGARAGRQAGVAWLS